MKFLELYISAVILWIAFYIVGTILFEEKFQMKKIILLIINIALFSIILAYVNYINSEILEGVIKIITIYSLYCIFYKILFQQPWSKILIASLILYLNLFIAEIIIAILASYALNSIAFLKNTIIINFLISSLNLIIIRMSKKFLVSFVKNNNMNDIGSIIIILIILVTLALLVFKIPISQWNFNAEFIITMLILLCFCIVGLFLLKQISDIQKTTSMYQQLVQYSDITNGLLEDYRVISHEQKNQLLIIRSMVEANNKELADYVDNLLDKRVGIKYEWIGQLNNLPLSGLKGLINYKLIEAETINIQTNISISKEISKTKLSKLSTKQKDRLYSIIGVYLDNAIQAAKEGKRKEISLEIYKEKKEIVIVLANTYNGTIELDKLDNYGYTTKGKNHGTGLHIVKKIMEEDPIFSQSRRLFEDYYVQELRINLSKLNQKKTNK